MKRLAELLSIRPGEGRLAGLVLGVMLTTAAGSIAGSTGLETLFFTRFGVQYLPYMFMVLGIVTMATSLAITAVLGRVSRERLYIALPFILAAILVVARLALLLNFVWLYPALWLGKEVINTLIGFLVWGVAGAVCDARQSKRLFPLFNAGRILGSVLGGLATGLFVSWAGTENLLLLWVGTLLLAFVFCQLLLHGHASSTAQTRRSKRKQPNFITEMRRGYQYVRGSQLMRWISIAAILFSMLYFSISLPFSRAATEHYPDENTLAGFLGAFQGFSTAAAFLASLFFANRLFARFGIMSMLLALPVIYLLGFGGLVIAPLFIIVIAFRFLQMLWLSGIADPAYQAMFNVVSPDRRDQVRTFIGGVPEQAGTFIAGLVLIIGEQALKPGQLYWIGLLAAAACTYVIWQSRRAYTMALVDALRAGRPQIFFSEEQAFGGFRRDAAAMSALIAGTRDDDLIIRRVSTEILSQFNAPEADEALINALYDSDSIVRINAMRAMLRGNVNSAMDEIKACLTDADSEVRAEAIECLQAMLASSPDLISILEPSLHDPIPAVCIYAAKAILHQQTHAKARDLLRDLAVHGEEEIRIAAITALGEVKDVASFDLIVTQFKDAAIPVRRAAALALANLEQEKALEVLIHSLDDSDIKEAVAEAIGKIGAPALGQTLAALSQLEFSSGALLALQYFPIKNSKPVEDFSHWAVSRALHYDGAMRSLDDNNECMGLLNVALHEQAHQHGILALQAAGLLSDREAINLAVENLTSRDASQRANVLETLESISERRREIIRPLLRLWDDTQTSTEIISPALLLPKLLNDPNPWVRACTAFAGLDYPELKTNLEYLSQTDPDALVREIASNGEYRMDSLPTLSLMERILFFRRVPLFEKLSTTDLKQIASISEEMLFSNTEELAAQGEPGDTMFIIVSGNIKVTASKSDGTITEIARRKPGDCVGEMAIISKEPRIASLIADGDVRTLCIDQKSFEGLLRERPEVSLGVMQVLCTRLKEMAN